jgi:hypothetical protein
MLSSRQASDAPVATVPTVRVAATDAAPLLALEGISKSFPA